MRIKSVNYQNTSIAIVTCLGLLFSIISSFLYGYSYDLFLWVTIITLAFTYGSLVINFKKINKVFLLLFVIIVLVSIMNGVIRDNYKNALNVSPCLLVPLVFSAFDYKKIDDYKAFIPVCILTLLFAFLQLRLSILGEYNVNTLGFMLYMGSSFSIVWLKTSKKKLLPVLYIAISIILMFFTECRNSMLISIFIGVLTLLPISLYKKKTFYRTIYIFGLLYTIFALPILIWGFKNPFVNNLLNDFSQSFSTKEYGMNMRIEYFQQVAQKISDLSLFERFFGTGVNNGSGHNMFYQGIFVYGYVGTIVIYSFYVYVFEKAFELLKNKNDIVAFSLFLGLLGNILLQGADEYLICNPSCMFLPLIMAGMILSKYRKYKNEEHAIPSN